MLLQGLMLAAVGGLAAFLVSRVIDVFQTLRVWVAAFALASVALVLDALGLHAAGWAALGLIVSLFVLGASFMFMRQDERP